MVKQLPYQTLTVEVRDNLCLQMTSIMIEEVTKYILFLLSYTKFGNQKLRK